MAAAEDSGYPRIGIAGVNAAFTGATPDVLAQALSNRRVVFVWPPAFLYYNTALNVTQRVDGTYFAAGCAGVLANNKINRGLTRSQVRTFAGIPADQLVTMTTPNKNFWSSKGVLVAEIDRTSRLVVRHGVTTGNFSTIQDREISIVREEDSVFENIQLALIQADLIGDPITEDTALSVKGIVQGAGDGAGRRDHPGLHQPDGPAAGLAFGGPDSDPGHLPVAADVPDELHHRAHDHRPDQREHRCHDRYRRIGRGVIATSSKGS